MHSKAIGTAKTISGVKQEDLHTAQSRDHLDKPRAAQCRHYPYFIKLEIVIPVLTSNFRPYMDAIYSGW
jgi:hypothetical protein